MNSALVRFEQVGVGVSLGSLYAAVLSEWLGISGLWPATQLEVAILVFIFARLALFVIVPRLRKAKAAVAVIFFGADVFMVIAAAAAVSVTGNPSYGDFGKNFMLAWIGAAPIGYPPLALFLLLRSLEDGTKLSYVLPGAASFFGMLIIPLAAMAQGSGSGGLTGLAFQMVEGLKGTAALGPTGPIVPFAGTLAFVSLLLHAVGGVKDTGPGDLAVKLAIVVAGVLFTLAWVFFIVPIATVWFTLGLPVLCATGAVWLITRAK